MAEVASHENSASQIQILAPSEPAPEDFRVPPGLGFDSGAPQMATKIPPLPSQEVAVSRLQRGWRATRAGAMACRIQAAWRGYQGRRGRAALKVEMPPVAGPAVEAMHGETVYLRVSI